MKKLAVVLFVICFTLSVGAQDQPIQKSDLKVLFVGQNPDAPLGYYSGGVAATWDDIKKERAKVFHEFLQQYFNTVTLVYGEDYKETLSDQHDVTIFDALIPQLDGEITKVWSEHNAPDYLSEDYDAATILIANVSAPILRNKKSKINWLCHCLDSHAFSINEAHPIFNTPFKVNMTKENRKHNNGVFYYYSGKDISTDEVPMLRMQDIDTIKGYGAGFVSSPGFGDSPDAEVIARGPSIKSVKSVSIGRHGNFFQWGYKADPRHLTETGKQTLINAIHYIAKYKGQKPFVKRVTPHKLAGLDLVFRVSDKGYAHEMAFSTELHHRYNDAKVKKMSGEKLSAGESLDLKRNTKFPDRTHFLSIYVPKELIKKYKNDWNAYMAHYEDNMGYLVAEKKTMYGEREFVHYRVEIDKDLQKLAIANNDIKLLETCVTMLEKGEQSELAQKLLTKYTTKEFTSARQWKKWLKKNKDKLFFTETGGYKWMVNQYL